MMTNENSVIREDRFSTEISQWMFDLQCMHKDISTLLSFKEKRSVEYIEIFSEIISQYISKSTLFSNHILWEVVDQQVPNQINPLLKDTLLFVDITTQQYRNAPLTTHAKFHYPKDECFFSQMAHGQDSVALQPILQLPLEPGYFHIDMPVFYPSESNPSLIITLIFQEDNRALIDDERMGQLLHYFSQQVSLAWERFIQKVADSLLDKIDQKIGNGNNTAKPSTIDHLKHVARVITQEFHSTWCGFFITDELSESLKLEAANIDSETQSDHEYPLKDSSISLVRCFSEASPLRLSGRENLETILQPDWLKPFEKAVRNFKIPWKLKNNRRLKFPYVLFEHALFFPMISNEKSFGIIALFRSKNAEEFAPPQEERFSYVMRPFTRFEMHLLEKVEKYIFNFLMSHYAVQKRMRDIRNILSQVISPISETISSTDRVIIHKDMSDMPGRLYYVNSLSKIAAHYVTNFETLLDIDTRSIKLHKSHIPDLRKYLIQYARLYTPLIRPKCISINVTEQTSNDISLHVDVDLFEVVILNVLDNAVMYSFTPEDRLLHDLQAKPVSKEDKENILIDASQEADWVTITISNYGIEILDNEKKSIFQREVRGYYAPDRTKGTGIGLFLVKEIIEKHGGSIQLLPNTPKYNTVFKLRIPNKMNDNRNQLKNVGKKQR